MRWLAGVTVAGLAGLAGPAAAQLDQPGSISMLRGGGTWQPALFVCDGIDRDRVLVVSAPDARRRAMLTALAKPGLATASAPVRIGEGDAGMSQVYFPLLAADGRAVGNIHTVSPGVVNPGATTPTVTSVTYRDDTMNCRFAPQTRVLGATLKRSVQVTATPRTGYRYRSYDYDTNLPRIAQDFGGRDTRASLTMDNGRLVDQRGGRRVYEFRNGGFVYRVFASVDVAKGGGGVQVWQSGRLIQTEPFGAYTAAIAP
ncbi:hypothetical protein ASG29_12935 [Sphingomonas sp. Leaf412]|uniref:hypothetical protein n=1 Tax=Sphingomonas sp. Leaf412 TaxID=1736370 RepID=UPI0006FC5C25|nr:hypothetical protein [Sphingomonas sp. Leaf412]KQT32639.1 hypothetical protein ASG29_12935 [Sphingomonas sp. Leaf412]